MLVNKPSGPTSHDMVDRLRKITKIRKIGHAGTLDPFASGLLIMAIGRMATREISRFVKLDKEYIATLHLGATSDTHDRTGKILRSQIADRRSQTEIQGVLGSFMGKQEQVPPMYSAKKVGGRKLYQLARQGKTITRYPDEIEIYSIELLEYLWPELVIKVKCSSGAYIRSLAHDIGQALGCGAYLTELKRTAIGGFSLAKAIETEKLNHENWPDFLV